MKPVVLFGDGLVASLAHFYLNHDSDREVAAFAVDREHRTFTEKSGLPVVADDELTDRYPPDDFDMLVAVGYGRMNRFRQAKYEQAKERGYELISYISSRAVTWPDLQIGDNCFIMEGNLIQPFVTLGSNIIMWGGSHVGHDSVIGDHVFISSQVVVSGGVNVGQRSFLGVNSTVRDEVIVASETLVGAGVVVTKDTKPKSVLAAARPEVLPITSDRLPRI
jgi:sugar O-acyltransferase (sialic acid O-acetyltransferase NeuD family)